MGMKMAKASPADLEAAMDVVRILESLDRGLMPSEMAEDEDEDGSYFDTDDSGDCKKALNLLLDAADKGSIGRVVYGMFVLLDPNNEAIDPNLDYIEHHPKRIEADKVRQQRDELLEALKRLADAAECRDNTMGDACRLIAVKAELASAAAHSRAAIAKAEARKP